MTVGLIPDMPEADYHAHPALSSTGVRRILDSPARFKYLQDHGQKPKSEFDLGSAVHAKVLGVGYGVEWLDFDSFRTADARKARDQARAEGKIPMLVKDRAEVDAVAEAVLGNPTARALFEQEGTAEASLFATDPDTGVEVRARFDFLGKIAVDLKTTSSSAAKTQFAKSVASFGYDVQQEHYELVHELVMGGRVPFVFVVVETEPPHLVGIHQLDREFVEIGAKKAARGRRLFRECSDSGIWPGLPSDVQLLAPPMYHVYDFQENYE